MSKLGVYFGKPIILKHKVGDEKYIIIAVSTGKESYKGVGFKIEDLKEILPILQKISGD